MVMPDPKLQEMLHPKRAVVVDRYEQAISEQIEKFLSVYSDLEEGLSSKLVSKEMRRARLSQELKQELKFEELGQHLNRAVEILLDEGRKYFPEGYDQMERDFENGYQKLLELDLNQKINTSDLQDLLQFSPATLSSIVNCAKEKFKEEQYENCLSIFILLTTLDEMNPEYWFRVGIAAQYCENVTLALKVFGVAKYLDPEMIGPRVLSADCYLQLDQRDNAQKEYIEAKKIIEETDVELFWQEYFDVFEKQFNS